MNQNIPSGNNMTNIENYINAETEKKIQAIAKEDQRVAEIEKEQLEPEKEKARKAMEKNYEDYKTEIKIELSKTKNRLRLDQLKVKIDCIDNIFGETRNQLKEKIKNDPESYKTVLKNLIVQGFIKLLEENITILCKQKDYDIVCGLVEVTKKEFVEKLKTETKKYKVFKMNVSVDSKYFLPENSIGGVFLTALKSKIRVDNTLDKRLELFQINCTPEIRSKLFPKKIDN